MTSGLHLNDVGVLETDLIDYILGNLYKTRCIIIRYTITMIFIGILKAIFNTKYIKLKNIF